MTDTEIILSALAFSTSAWAVGATVAAGLMMRGNLALIAPLKKELRAFMRDMETALERHPCRSRQAAAVTLPDQADAIRGNPGKTCSKNELRAFEDTRRRLFDDAVTELAHHRDPLIYFEWREAERKEYLNRRAAQRRQSDPSLRQEGSLRIPGSDSGSVE